MNGNTAAGCAAVALWFIHTIIHFQRKVPQSNENVWLLSHDSLYRTASTAYQLDPSTPIIPANWHPPLMWLVTQLFMRTGLDALQSSLAVNLLSGFVTILATWWLGYGLARCEKLAAGSDLGNLGVALLCTIPLFQAASGVIDIDNGLLTAIMTLYLAVLIGSCDRPSRLRLFLLAVILGSALLAKISTPLILIPFTYFCFWDRERSFWRALRSSGVIILLGLILFGLVYAMTRPLFTGDWYAPFLHNSSSLTFKAIGYDLEKWVSRFRTLVELLLWIGPPAGALVFTFIWWSWLAATSTPAPKILPVLLLGYVISIWGVFAYLGVTFNLRYMVPSLPVFAVVTAFFLGRQGTFTLCLSRPWKFIEIAGVVFLLSCAFYLLPDPILFSKTDLKRDFWRAGYIYSGALISVSVGTYFLLWWLRKRGAEIRNMAVTWLVCLWLVFNLNTSVKQILGNYQLSYGYGTSEYAGVVQWVKEHGRDGIPIFVPRDFLWILRGTNQPIYLESSRDNVLNANQDKQEHLLFYQVLRRQTSTVAEEARPSSTMYNSEELYRNKDFLIIRSKVPRDHVNRPNVIDLLSADF